MDLNWISRGREQLLMLRWMNEAVSLSALWIWRRYRASKGRCTTYEFTSLRVSEIKALQGWIRLILTLCKSQMRLVCVSILGYFVHHQVFMPPGGISSSSPIFRSNEAGGQLAACLKMLPCLHQKKLTGVVLGVSTRWTSSFLSGCTAPSPEPSSSPISPVLSISHRVRGKSVSVRSIHTFPTFASITP